MATRMRIMKTLMKSGNPNIAKAQVVEAAKKKKWNIVRGDKVQVIGNHPEKGKQGIVKQVLRDRDRVTIEGINLAPRQIKGDLNRGLKGSRIIKERSIHYSKVNLVCPVTNQPTRIFRKFLDDGTKVRVSKKSGAIIPRPEILKVRKKVLSPIITQDDTLDEDVW
eukprot:CAMPEP_0202444272 /NCGR_PEP_ID=MMETSP1360-20130828/3411_1 /ASSEMBLY_ACC=CAM_ASM_000848 /TAXON_ID=515479 /ORGANISM="Licmophora paradoxa, Strain CCMP2313" /LENGTH=164 /DNA_ID=CAMNT_0049060233 /DNA_START=185 /DNA_END=676 /DNA_ORIENTATION=-